MPPSAWHTHGQQWDTSDNAFGQFHVLGNVVDDLLTQFGSIILLVVDVLIVDTNRIHQQLSHRIDLGDSATSPGVVR